jgi:NitT/TauT family transport system permease protein
MAPLDDPVSATKDDPVPRPDFGNEISGKTRRPFMWPYATITVVALMILWQIGTYVFEIPEYLLPSPSAILADSLKDWSGLLSQSATTAFEVALGFLLSVLVGLPLAAFLTYSPGVERAVYPLIVGSNTVPKVALAPLLLAWLGFGIAPKIVIVVLVTFFPIVINSAVGFKSLAPEMYHLARSMGASGMQVFWRFRLPNALPSIFAGLKVASVLSVIGAVVAEFVGADSGLGYVMMVATSDLNIARQFAAILLLSVIGMIFFRLVELIERSLLPWHSSIRSESISL